MTINSNISEHNILVFGAAGFMGTYLVNELIKLGYKVTASDIDTSTTSYYQEQNIPFIAIDITKASDFEKLNKDTYTTVIHLAAHQPANVSDSNDQPEKYINVNVLGTLNILKYCKNQQIKKIIYASSHRNTQGLWKNECALTEDDGRLVKFDTEYTLFSISETAAQDLVEYFCVQHNLQGIVFRLPPVYGYGPHTEIFKEGKPIKTGFQIFIDKAMSCEPIEVWGNCDTGRDIVYIKDVINAFTLAIDNPVARGLYNISSGYKLSLLEEAETIADVFWGNESKPTIIKKPEIPNHIDSFYYNIKKAEKELGWKPKFSFKEMLYDFIKETSSEKYKHLLTKRKNNR